MRISPIYNVNVREISENKVFFNRFNCLLDNKETNTKFIQVDVNHKDPYSLLEICNLLFNTPVRKDVIFHYQNKLVNNMYGMV
jgi:hypothetical protein